MTMFKTKEQIEEMAFPWFLSDTEVCEAFEEVKGRWMPWTMQRAYVSGYTQAQQDIKEACSEGFVEWLNNSSSLTSEQVKKFRDMNEQGRIGFALSEGFTAGKISSMKELQEKDEIIVNKVNKIIERDKEIQEKDEEIKEIRKALQIIYDNSRANYIDRQEQEKFRQIVEKYKLHKY